MVVTRRIDVQTRGNCDLIDITPQVAKQVRESGVNSGTATLFLAGSTAGLITIEFESGLLSDFKEMWQRLIPSDVKYRHNLAWGEGNGHSHVRASVLGASLVVPFVDKVLTLGTWQQIVLADFDICPRSRQVILQIMGE